MSSRRHIGMIHRLFGFHLAEDADILIMLKQGIHPFDQPPHRCNWVIGFTQVCSLAGRPQYQVIRAHDAGNIHGTLRAFECVLTRLSRVGSDRAVNPPWMFPQALRRIVEDRDPFPNVFESANWTSVGILVLESAMQGGKLIQLPDYK